MANQVTGGRKPAGLLCRYDDEKTVQTIRNRLLRQWGIYSTILKIKMVDRSDAWEVHIYPEQADAVKKKIRAEAKEAFPKAKSITVTLSSEGRWYVQVNTREIYPVRKVDGWIQFVGA